MDFFEMLKREKASDEKPDEQKLIDYLTAQERAYFWNPTPEEQQQWHEHWFSTPLEIRHSPEMPTPPWHLESMLDAFWNGDYELLDIREKNGRYYLTFNPHGYPYGGTGCMVAMLECFGHKVLGIDDGTGYEKHSPQAVFWKPEETKQ